MLMYARFEDRLNASRQTNFVGRQAERDLFRAALLADELPFQMLYLYGPGGVGKTTLLHEFTRICRAENIVALELDARSIDPTPEGFTSALFAALPPAPSVDAVFETLAAAGRAVLMIDTYELLAPLDDWLRESLLPRLPLNTLVVLAGRGALAPAWRAAPGWNTLLHVIALRNLSGAESLTYLTQRAVPTDQHQAVLHFTHGYPLALSLVADLFAQTGARTFEPESAPDVVKTLLERFLMAVPSAQHRAALEVCALVRLTTEALLADALQVTDAHDLFEWLRGLSFIEFAREGLFPHDLAREALITDLRWRNPDWYTELHLRLRRYFGMQWRQRAGAAQQRVILDFLFLHRDNAMVRPAFDWQTHAALLPDSLHPDDIAPLTARVAAHEGRESAHIAAYWLRQQPGGVVVLRDARRQAVGFLHTLTLDGSAHPEAAALDPAYRAAHAYLRSLAPLRAGEVAALVRFWMAHETYQAVSPVQTAIFVHILRAAVTTPGLALTLLTCAEPDFWRDVFAYGDLHRLPECDFEVGGRRYGVYGHDWRSVPAFAWLALLADREMGGMSADHAPKATLPLVVLSEDQFAQAVREALRDYADPDALRDSPLLQSRLVSGRISGDEAGERERAAALRTLLRETAESLQSAPRSAKFYRVLHHTYLQPAPTQEKAAELLDMPFSTYRRHLKAGIDRMIEMLWAMELSR